MPHVLVIDDEPEACELVELLLVREGIKVTTCQDPAVALELIIDQRFDAVLTDLTMPGMDGLELCQRVLGTRPDLPVIVLTGAGSIDVAVSAIRIGAFDFLTKPTDPKLLLVAIHRAMEHRQLVSELERLEVGSAPAAGDDGVLGSSAPMRRAFALVHRVASSEASVLIHGETGTGKELVARQIHAQSSRAKGPFIAVNCAAVQPALFESELFGHVRGAFTDAKDNRRGLFLEAAGGTIFLDEVGELPLELQPKLLRALQERTIRPVGSDKEHPFDSRIISATNRVLEDEIFENRFREDLYYRLNVVRIDIPALRERDGDIPLLAQHFLNGFAEKQGLAQLSLTPAAVAKLVAYPWPGNVRELENCMERAIALCRGGEVGEADLPDKVREHRAKSFGIAANNEGEIVTMDALERTYVARALSLLGGNKTRAAQALGIDRRTLYRKLAEWEAAPPPAAHR
jgi:two-component system response regulator HydG